MSLVKNFKTHLFHTKIIKRGDGIILGLSGGPDSVCLAHLLFQVKKSYQLEIALAHVNYGLRGEDSELDEKFAKQLAEDLDFPIYVKHYLKANKKKEVNLEDDMRNFRYAFFRKLKKEQGFNKIATAHHGDDLVETFLMNLIRGAALDGLTPFNNNDQTLIRPLLFTDKQKIRKWLEQNNLGYRIDKSNSDNSFFRNSLRNELIPLIEKRYNPNFKSNVKNLTQQLGSIKKIVENNLEKDYTKMVTVISKQELAFDLEKLKKLDDFSLGEVCKKAFVFLTKSNKTFRKAFLFEIKKVVASQKGKRQQLELANLIITRKNNQLFFKLKR